MTNLSDLTRKGQVLAYLRARENQWVDGPELATEEVGGSEGLRRLRELRMSGLHDIRERRHPDAQRDIWQYMLVGRVAHKPLDLGELDTDDAKPSYPDHTTEAARREEEAQRLLDLSEPEPPVSPWPADHDQTRISTAVVRKEDGTFEYVPPQRTLVELTDETPQPPGAVFERMPSRIVWGETVICPRCRQKTTRGRKKKPGKDEGLEPEHIRQRKRKNKEGPSLVDPDGVLLFRDPSSKTPMPCRRCNGYGIVPNQGPIAMGPLTGLPPAPVGEEPVTTEAFEDETLRLG